MKKGKRKKWIKILTISRLYKAEIAKDLLEEEGLVAVIVNKLDSSWLYTISGSVELYVKTEDHDAALKILKNFKSE